MKKCNITLNSKGSKEVNFGKSWEGLAKGNATFMQTGNGMYVIDLDTKKVPKALKILGVPTIETKRGYHWYVKSEVDMTTLQAVLPNVDIRGNGGLVFTSCEDSKIASYIKTGKEIKGKKADKVTAWLLDNTTATVYKKREVKERSDDVMSLDEVKTLLKQHDIKEFSNREDWMRMLAAIYDANPKAKKLAIKWSKGDAGQFDIGSFNSVWSQLETGQYGESITRGTLIGASEKVDVFEDVEVVKSKDLYPYDRWVMSEGAMPNAIHAYISNTVYLPTGSKFLWVSSSGNTRYFAKAEAHILLNTAEIVNHDVSEEYKSKWCASHDVEVEKYNKEHTKWLRGKIVDYIIKHKQIDSMSYKVDPWLDKPTMQYNQKTRVGTITLNNVMQGAKPKKIKDKAVIADYKEHFPMLDGFLKVIASMRFGADTKSSYLWLNASSNWGKSLLFENLLKSMGIVVSIKEKELKKAMSGDPVGMSQAEFTYAWFLVFDEFSGAVSELKDITHTLTLSPKNQPRCTVDIYGKIFLSADNVASLRSDSVDSEKQFGNRFAVLELDGDLVRRELYNTNQYHYKEVLRYYIYTKLMKEAKKYIEIGKSESSTRANKLFNEFREAHPLDDKGDDGVSIHEDLLSQFYAKVTKDLKSGISSDHLDSFSLSDKGVLRIHNIGMAKAYFLSKMVDLRDQKNYRLMKGTKMLGLNPNRRLFRSGGRQITYYELVMQ